MNKIKLLYDVVLTIRSKEAVKGTLAAEVQKDGENVFSLKKKFEKTFPAPGNFDAENECCGDEFDAGKFGGPGHHMMFKHLRAHHHGCCGIKGKLDKLAFALSILNNLEAEEQGDGTAVLTLSLENIPEEIKALCRERREHLAKMKPENCCKINDCCCMERHDLTIKVSINANNDITRIEITFEGEKEDGSKVEGKAEVNFSW